MGFLAYVKTALLFGILLFLGLGFLFQLRLLGYEIPLLLLQLLLEAFYASGRIDDFLLAGVDRVAGAADFDIDLLEGRFGHESVPTDAFYGTFFVIRVDIFFHCYFAKIDNIVIKIR